MVDDIMEFNMDTSYEPIIKIIGVGGGGSNAVEYMYSKGISDVEFVVCNTDAMALEACSVPTKIQLGITLSQGNGAGNNPMNGEQAAIENLDDIVDSFTDNTRMIFLTAGMGGGTGTGATPVIAKAAKAKGILTVAIVTIPFRFEGPQRILQAVEGISRLSEYVDSLLVIDNEKLKMIYGDLGLSNAFAKADDVVANAARGIAELITLPGYVNVDFEDVRTVMLNSGVAVMGAARSSGEDRAIDAIKLALESPLLDNNQITGAKEILLNIVSGEGDNEITMDEVTTITDHVLEQVGGEAQVIWGVGSNPNLNEDISVTIVATGFKAKTIEEMIDTPYITNLPKAKTFFNNKVDIDSKGTKISDENSVLTQVDTPREDLEINGNNHQEGILDSKPDLLPVDNEVDIKDKDGDVNGAYTKTLSLPESEGDEEDINVTLISDKNISKPIDIVKKEEFQDPTEKKDVEDKKIESIPEGVPDIDDFEEKDNDEECENIYIDESVVSDEKLVIPQEPGAYNQKVDEEDNISIRLGKSSESSVSKTRAAGEVYYGEVVMKPEMSESMIRKIENTPAYKRRKAID